MFTPFELAGLRLPNRVVMPPMVVWKATKEGLVTPEVVEHYRRTAGPGMVIVEASAVSPEGRLDARQIGIFEDGQVEGLAKIAALIHETGAAASIQIHHAGRNTNRANTLGQPLVAPSALAVKKDAPPDDVPMALDEQGIERILDCFAAAAQRAAEAGFDAVEIHGAHGYLVSQFLSPLANLRQDSWGGSLENRARFLREAHARIRKACAGKILISCRLGVADKAGGLTVDEGIQVARWLAEDGMPWLHVSTGIGDPPRLAPEGSPWSDRLLLGARIREAVGIPVIGVGDIYMPEQAEKALAEGLVDLVAVGRGLLADPLWVVKIREGRAEAIHLCHRCRICHHFRHAERCPARKEAASASS
jgi:NADPH2 dehydrogenase